MSKTIFRAEKNADNPFVMIDRRPVENPLLSWRAKGILTYLISRPDNWIVRIGDLIKRSPEGAYAVRKGIRELTQAGHITRKEERDAGKFKQYVLLVHELPLRDKPQAETPQAVNRALNDTDSVNENEFNKKPVISGIAASILSGRPTTLEDIASDGGPIRATTAFEGDLGFNPLPWDGAGSWLKLKKFVGEIHARFPDAFKRYAKWREGDGKYKAMQNKQIRAYPDRFIDNWPEFEATLESASARNREGALRNYVNEPERRMLDPNWKPGTPIPWEEIKKRKAQKGQ